jgi:Arc/MetJ-type ribon-helix-helix transcriptional regulator
MNAQIPADLAPFVERMVTERRFLNESDVLAAGLRLLQARETLIQEVRTGFEELDRGQGIPAEDAFRRAERAVDEVESNHRAAS